MGKKAYIIQFEMTEVFGSAQKAAEYLKGYYSSFDWSIDSYADELDGRDLSDVSTGELKELLKRKNHFFLLSGREEVRVYVREIQ